MKQAIQSIASLLVIILLGLIVFSCSPERKLANSFVKSDVKKSALLLSTDKIFKTSLKTAILDSLEIFDKNLFDSVLYAHSDFLQEIDDPIFLRNYILGLEKELKTFGFDIYHETQMADFMEVDSNAFIIYLAQIEIEEAFFPFRDETESSSYSYYYDHQLNSVSVYSWFEINKVNEKKGEYIYFADDVIVDEVDGNFTLDFFGGDVKYFYEIDSLETKDLYEYAFMLGRTYAGYTFDLLLNTYIRKNMPEEPKDYWRYDPYTESFFPATNDKFISLDE